MEYLALKNIIRKKHTRRREILSFGDRMKEKKWQRHYFFSVFFFSDAKHGEENGMIVENN